MNSVLPDHLRIKATVRSLDPTKTDCCARIAAVRIEMDEACNHGLMTIRQWSDLLDAVAVVQSKMQYFTRSSGV